MHVSRGALEFMRFYKPSGGVFAQMLLNSSLSRGHLLIGHILLNDPNVIGLHSYDDIIRVSRIFDVVFEKGHCLLELELVVVVGADGAGTGYPHMLPLRFAEAVLGMRHRFQLTHFVGGSRSRTPQFTPEPGPASHRSNANRFAVCGGKCSPTGLFHEVIAQPPSIEITHRAQRARSLVNP
jgi:hypothetical protein